ncbi:winged helix-turn-helix transcriptional regulator [Actinomadura geliboluensis]|uniref:Helix-turn-helix transcriptional regulator n=1 Tax=Actinomadura geliboluensis TaxID=882440 RepID=A0A5S4HK23_9ACTN|nr:helix-turn-helix domain-containing protein [Actinomadura geliboluensis]TMR40890.1 helix-turn-helix transcriptional regulator [Actinomadura geliboluensis]
MKVTGPKSRSRGVHDLPVEALPILGILHRRWAPHLIYVLGQGPARFSELQISIPGITATSLSTRLQALIDEGLVTRQVCPGPPISSRYQVTARGRDLAEGLSRMLAGPGEGAVARRPVRPQHQLSDP